MPPELAQRQQSGPGSWAGPFTVSGCPEPHDGFAVFDKDGQPFCLITDDLPVGGRSGAKARATLIAEALNKHGR